MIDPASTLRIAMRSLRANKLRSALTMLGMIIGTAAVIVMLALGAGASDKIAEQISAAGSNLIIVVPGATTAGGVRMGSGTRATLTFEDARALKRECPDVLLAAPAVNGVAQVLWGSQNWSTGVQGTVPDVLEIRDWRIAGGRFFSEEDVRNGSKVAVLGRTVADNLFGGEDPEGKVIRIKNIPFLVLGVLERKGQAMNGQDQDDTVMVPITAAQRNLFGAAFPGQIGMIGVKAADGDGLMRAEEQIKEVLRQRHRIGPKQDDDFTVRNLTAMMEMAASTAEVMSLLLGMIASISLIVGGIGIMNIMLVSVTERTREIGIRMAVGARVWDIRLQFLIEAMLISLIGGAVGMTLGASGAVVLAGLSEWPARVSALSVVLSFGVSALTGLVFGYYPAAKASLMNPIEALRYE